MNKLAWAGLGAGAMYFLDPNQGTRRQALVRDQAVRYRNRAELALGKIQRDVSNRAQGLLTETRMRFSDEGPISDDVLSERVRAKIGRVVSHPRSIEVTVNDGRVVLSGPILAREAQRVIRSVGSVRGVVHVENRLDLHPTPGDVPGLQGEPRPRLERPEFLQENWSPTTRVLAGTVGSALAMCGLVRRGAPGMALGTMGLGLLGLALGNVGLGTFLSEPPVLATGDNRSQTDKPSGTGVNDVQGERGVVTW